MSKKFNLLRNHFQSADLITGPDHDYNFQVRNDSFEFISEQDPKVVLTYSAQDVEEAVIQDGLVTLREQDFEAKKVTIIQPPVVLQSHDDLANVFENIASEHDSEVYEGYSGRCMMGSQCWGITTNDPEGIIATARGMGIDGERQDSMGRSAIVYWPHIKYTKPVDQHFSAGGEELVAG